MTNEVRARVGDSSGNVQGCQTTPCRVVQRKRKKSRKNARGAHRGPFPMGGMRRTARARREPIGYLPGRMRLPCGRGLRGNAEGANLSPPLACSRTNRHGEWRQLLRLFATGRNTLGCFGPSVLMLARKLPRAPLLPFDLFPFLALHPIPRVQGAQKKGHPRVTLRCKAFAGRKRADTQRAGATRHYTLNSPQPRRRMTPPSLPEDLF